MSTAASSEADDLTDHDSAGFTSTDTVSPSDVTASSDVWNLLERIRLFNTMTTSYNWSARFDGDRDRDKTFTIVISYRTKPNYFADLSFEQATVYLTTAIEDYFRRENGGLEDYFFE